MHNEKRTDWKKEAGIQCFVGGIYGGTNTLVGHPFDTIKTKMQAQTEHMSASGGNHGVIQTVKNVYKVEGPLGFYRGWVPPFFGSVIFRSLQFTVYDMVHTNSGRSDTLKKHIPLTGGLEWRVFIAGFAAGSVRSCIECPFEYAKVKRQTG